MLVKELKGEGNFKLLARVPLIINLSSLFGNILITTGLPALGRHKTRVR